MIKVLFVCMGNICRSPTAQGVFQRALDTSGLADRVEVDSAGTHAYHVGSQPDDRSQEAALQRGIDLSDQQARVFEREDFEAFDYVLAMDEDNFHHLMRHCPADQQDKVRLFLEFSGNSAVREVPDPYYGGDSGFEHVLDLIEVAADGLIMEIRQRLS